MLMTELAYIVKRALGPRVKEVIYISDSMIALSWCSSLEKLRLFVQNSMSTILRMVQWTLALSDADPLPLYHVDGEMNIADLLTKEHSITVMDVSEGSLWQTGPAWLTLPVSAMPLKKYDQIFMKKEEEKEALKECYSLPFWLRYIIINQFTITIKNEDYLLRQILFFYPKKSKLIKNIG